jgi:P-type Cu+ transporter
VQDTLVGLIAVADTIREDAKDMIKEIKKMDKEVILISGDNKRTTNAIAKKLGIEKVMSQVSPTARICRLIKVKKSLWLVTV